MKNVLIVDDDPIQIEIARELLSSLSVAEISFASDSKTAKEILTNGGPFELLLLDLHMPDYDGVEFLEYLRDIDFQGAIVIVSAADQSLRDGATELGRAYRLNVVSSIVKPLTVQSVVAALADI